MCFYHKIALFATIRVRKRTLTLSLRGHSATDGSKNRQKA